jgi:hypothetical protein
MGCPLVRTPKTPRKGKGIVIAPSARTKPQYGDDARYHEK